MRKKGPSGLQELEAFFSAFYQTLFISTAEGDKIPAILGKYKRVIVHCDDGIHINSDSYLEEVTVGNKVFES
jgi:hypothetical protein